MVSIIIPIFNEIDCIRDFLSELYPYCSKLDSFELLLIDDGSTDGTNEILKDFSKNHNCVSVITMPHNCGQSAAMWLGFQKAVGEKIITLDGDGQNPPSEILKCIESLSSCDVCCGYRATRHDSFAKRIGSKLANAIRRKILHDNIIDTGCSLKAFKAKYVKNLQYWNGMHRFLPMLCSMQGAKISQVKVEHRIRIAGKSKYSNFKRLKTTIRDLFGVKWLIDRSGNFYVKQELH